MKKHPVKFWITFWLISILLLAGWYFYWQVKNKGLETLNPIIAFLPISEQLKKELKDKSPSPSSMIKSADTAPRGDTQMLDSWVRDMEEIEKEIKQSSQQ